MTPTSGGFKVPPERHFVSVWHPARVLLDAPWRGVAPPDPREGFTLPDAVASAPHPFGWSMRRRVLAFFRFVWQLGTMNNMHQENASLYFATLADFIKSAQRELEKAQAQAPGTDTQSSHLAEARLKFAAAVRVIDRVLPNS